MSCEEDLRIHGICKKWRAHVKEYSPWLQRKRKGDCALTQEQFCKERGLDAPAFRWWIEYIGREDEYTYYASLASEYLGQTKRTLDLLERHSNNDPDLRMPLMRDAIVSYAALFGNSKGRVPRSFKLGSALVPDTLREIHDRICELRNKIIAHCDLSPRNPQVAPFGIMLRGVGFDGQCCRQLLAPFKDLIEAVQANIKSYRNTSGLARSVVAFQDIVDPPPGALEDPGMPSTKAETGAPECQ